MMKHKMAMAIAAALLSSTALAAQPPVVPNDASRSGPSSTSSAKDESTAPRDATTAGANDAPTTPKDATASDASSTPKDATASDTGGTGTMPKDATASDAPTTPRDPVLADPKDTTAAGTGVTSPAERERADTSTPATPPGIAGTISTGELLGMKVTNPDREALGEVAGLTVDQDGQVQEVLLSVGGFLGIGEKQVALAWAEFNWEPSEGMAVVSLTRDELERSVASQTQASRQ